ncbi:ribonuclease HI family protein [Candidatus Peregrinibacteria bacterium]|nr:ribonuclease HI family protein [Candidatus Peregrinibacteria bacterium]
MMEIEIYVDGGARGNPGPAGGGFAVYTNGKLAIKGSVFFGEMTNNQAEYLALREALRKTYAHYPEAKVRCLMDSKLVVEQMAGNYKVKSPNIKTLHAEVRRIADQFPLFRIFHIPREQNRLADRLANEAMDRGEK